MTKKDYELIASVIRAEYQNAKLYYGAVERDMVNNVKSALAYAFKQANPKFNRDKFNKACQSE